MKEPSYLSNESLPETCGLSKSELEAMAARQARKLETQEQLLAAKAQRLRFLKSGGEAERLQRLRDKVSTQEDRLRKLRALRGKVQNNRGTNSILNSDLESLRAVFNEKEKELSLAVAKVEDLTSQLDELRRGTCKEPQHGQSVAAVELEKLRRELMYRQKLREAQATRVAVQRAALSQRQEETIRVDRRIAELQERLHRKRLLNHQLAVTLKHQENVEDFVQGPTKNDPKYQTLPYNAKLFAPFASKHDRDNFESSVQQLKFMHLDPHHHKQQLDHHLHHYLFHQQQGHEHINQLELSNKSNHMGNYATAYSSNNLQLNQLNQLLNQNQHNTKSANQQQSQQLSTPALHHPGVMTTAQQKLSSSPLPSSSSNTTMASSIIPNGLQRMKSSQSSHLPRGKPIIVGASNITVSNISSHTNEIVVPYIWSKNFESTGSSNINTAPISSSGFTFVPGAVPSSSQLECTKEMYEGSNASASGSSVSDGYAPLSSDNIGSLHLLSGASGRSAKPALPPKPAKPTPPPRGQGIRDNYASQRLHPIDPIDRVGAMTIMPDRSELPIKPKPLFIMKNTQNMVTGSTGNELSALSVSTQVDKESRMTAEEKEQTNEKNNNSTAVRLSINRRIEMPPAFLFPESDPPPSDLVPEQHLCDKQGQLQQRGVLGITDSTPSSSLTQDAPDNTAPHFKASDGLHPEEYTLPDLFSHPHNLLSCDITNRLRNNNHDNLSSCNSTSLPNCNESCDFSNILDSNVSIGSVINNNNPKEFKESYFTELNQHNSSSHELGALRTLSTIANLNPSSSLSAFNDNMNLIRSTNINSSPIIIPDESSNAPEPPVMNENLQQHHQYQQQQVFERDDLTLVKVMSMQVDCPLGDSKIDLSLIQLESYEVEQEHPVMDSVIDQNVDRDENASDSTHSGSTSTITTTTSSISSAGAGSVVRILKKGNLKSTPKDQVPLNRRVSFDPLALLLDASLEGEFDLVVKTAGEVGNASAANDEGITALHNAICAGHAEVVRFLVEFGCDVNAQDSDGWTPLHCAASCNNVTIVKFLVERGACIFATTLSDHETAAEKCEEDEDGFGPCSEYLYSVQEKLGIINSGAVYAVFDYDAQNPDELTIHDGDRLVILRKGDEFEREWWWAVVDDKQGYIPRNLLGLYPRVVPHRSTES